MGEDHESFERALKVAHLIKYADDRIDDLQAFDLTTVSIEIQTLGKEGLKFRSPSSGNSWVFLPAYPAQQIADTSGSGDWCTAGMLYSLFPGGRTALTGEFTSEELAEALRFGQALAALNCSYVGARGLAQYQDAESILDMSSALQS